METVIVRRWNLGAHNSACTWLFIYSRALGSTSSGSEKTTCVVAVESVMVAVSDAVYSCREVITILEG